MTPRRAASTSCCCCTVSPQESCYRRPPRRCCFRWFPLDPLLECFLVVFVLFNEDMSLFWSASCNSLERNKPIRPGVTGSSAIAPSGAVSSVEVVDRIWSTATSAWGCGLSKDAVADDADFAIVESVQELGLMEGRLEFCGGCSAVKINVQASWEGKLLSCKALRGI